MRITEVLALLLAVLFIGFAGGCVWNKLDTRGDVARAEAKLEVANGNVDACAAALRDVQQKGEEDLAAADERAKQNQVALDALAQQGAYLEAELGSAQQNLTRARGMSTCREQLEVQLCAAVPLL